MRSLLCCTADFVASGTSRHMDQGLAAEGKLPAPAVLPGAVFQTNRAQESDAKFRARDRAAPRFSSSS
jgi:hypothetical protein